MTIKEVKTTLGVEALNLSVALDGEGQPTQWLRAWDDENRIATSIHLDLFNEIKADTKGEITTLGIQTETRISNESQREYTSKRIVKYTPATHVL